MDSIRFKLTFPDAVKAAAWLADELDPAAFDESSWGIDGDAVDGDAQPAEWSIMLRKAYEDGQDDALLGAAAVRLLLESMTNAKGAAARVHAAKNRVAFRIDGLD